jgi:hypothetical protein
MGCGRFELGSEGGGEGTETGGLGGRVPSKLGQSMLGEVGLPTSARDAQAAAAAAPACVLLLGMQLSHAEGGLYCRSWSRGTPAYAPMSTISAAPDPLPARARSWTRMLGTHFWDPTLQKHISTVL